MTAPNIIPNNDHEVILLLSREMAALSSDLRSWQGAINAQLLQGSSHFREVDKRLDHADAGLSDVRRIVQAETLRMQADLRAIEERLTKLDEAFDVLVSEIHGYRAYVRGIAWALGGVGLLAGVPALSAMGKLLGVTP